MTAIYRTLCDIGAVSADRIQVFRERTRDLEITVKWDPISGVIFIPDYYVGDAEYETGSFRQADTDVISTISEIDTKRRVQDMQNFWRGRSVLDFGCGRGLFLQAIHSETLKAQGVELERRFRMELNQQGIPCHENLLAVDAVDSVFMFHVLEHLPDPLTTLRLLHSKLKDDKSTIVVEVPHARDVLLATLKCQEFIDFTLWSQHLVLHTRTSLTLLLQAAGFRDVHVSGIQRYGLANHLKWLRWGKPGGHEDFIPGLESPELRNHYESALANLDCTDTLVAVARI